MVKNKLFLLRHLPTSYNTEKVIIGQLDIPITDLQKIEFGGLSKVKSLVIFASPLQRCKQTVETLQKSISHIQTEIIYVDELIERNFGVYQGKSKHLFGDDPNFLDGKIRIEVTPEGGESLVEFQNRVALAANQILEALKHNHVLVVSHLHTLKMLTLLLKNMQIEPNWYGFNYENGKIVEVSINKKIDLHLHSNVSDGKLRPASVVKQAHEYNIDIIALTDHDDVNGIAEAWETCKKYGMKLVPAMELSCASKGDIEGFPDDLSIHILGYNIDYKNPKLVDLLTKHRQRRVKKTKDIVDSLKKFGYNLKYSTIKIQAERQMRVADIINHLKSHFPKDENYDACVKYLKDDVFYDLLDYDFSVQEAISIIKDFGGQVVLAHPLLLYRDYQLELLNKDVFNILIDYLCGLGLDGIEVNYLAFDFAQKEYLKNIATERNLIATIGSDFHGWKNRVSMIGEECENEEELFGRVIV